jgi:hypothetical protein
MKKSSTRILIAALVVLLVVLIVAYEKGWLNHILPAPWRKTQMNFVGSYGRTPAMQNCLAFSDPSQRWTYFNRCNYM